MCVLAPTPTKTEVGLTTTSSCRSPRGQHGEGRPPHAPAPRAVNREKGGGNMGRLYPGGLCLCRGAADRHQIQRWNDEESEVPSSQE